MITCCCCPLSSLTSLDSPKAPNCSFMFFVLMEAWSEHIAKWSWHWFSPSLCWHLIFLGRAFHLSSQATSGSCLPAQSGHCFIVSRTIILFPMDSFMNWRHFSGWHHLLF